MGWPATRVLRSFRLDLFLVGLLGLTAGLALSLAPSQSPKWSVFIVFIVVSVSVFAIIRTREKFLLYLSVILTSVFLGFHPIFIESVFFPWPVSGFRITIFEVVFALLFLSWMLRLVLNPETPVDFYPRITLPLLLIWLLSLGGLLPASMPGIIKVTNLWLLLESWLIFLYFANNIRTRGLFWHIILALLCTGVLQALLGLAQYVGGGSLGLEIFGETKSYNVMRAGAEVVSRVSGTFGHPNNLAGFLVLLALLNLALLFSPLSPHFKLLGGGAFLLISTALVLTFSRGGWLALGLGGMVCLYLCLLRRTGKKTWAIFIAGGLLAIFFISSVALIGPLKRRLFEEDYGAARSRLPMAVVAGNIILHHPWLGVGLGNYTFAAPRYDISREGISIDFPRPVHNEFLLIAAEQGLPALALFLAILAHLLGQLLKVSRSNTDPVLPYIAIGLFSSYCGWIVFRQTDYNYVLLGDPFWLLAGLTVALKRLAAAPASGEG